MSLVLVGVGVVVVVVVAVQAWCDIFGRGGEIVHDVDAGPLLVVLLVIVLLVVVVAVVLLVMGVQLEEQASQETGHY